MSSWGEQWDKRAELSAKLQEFYNEDHVESGPDGGQFTGPGGGGSSSSSSSSSNLGTGNTGRLNRKGAALLNNIKELRAQPKSEDNDNAIARNVRDLKDVAPYVKDPKVSEQIKAELK